MKNYGHPKWLEFLKTIPAKYKLLSIAESNVWVRPLSGI